MVGWVRWLSISVVALVHVAVYWYPFSLDLPRRVDNTARQLANGPWDLDDASRVMIHLPGTLLGGAFSISVKARPADSRQTGPARLVSVGSNPYRASLMLGLDRGEVVVRLPCDEGASDAEWRVPWGSAVDLSIKLGPLGDGSARPLLQVDNRAPIELQHPCVGDQRALLALLDRPWTLGNVQSGHRPFVGQITGLELVAGDRRIDLLRDAIPETPASFWIWPERFYRPEDAGEQGPFPVIWHFLGFLALGYLLAAGPGPPTARQTMLIATAFSATLFAGKIFVAGRHPSIADVMLNLAGAATGFLSCSRFRRRSS